MGTGTGLTGSHPAEGSSPDVSQAASFGADTLLLTAFVISLGIPVYHALGLVAEPSIVALYVISATLVPTLTPALTWWLRWGRPDRRTTGIVSSRAFIAVVPGIALAVIVVGLGFEMALLGVGVMAFVAMLIMQVVSRRFGTASGLPRMDAARLLLALSTPLVVLWLTNALPHGVDAIAGWSIPMLVAATGAVGSGWGLRQAVGAGKGMNPPARTDRIPRREESHDGRTGGA